jgi:hypothetical protein
MLKIKTSDNGHRLVLTGSAHSEDDAIDLLIDAWEDAPEGW